MTPSLKRLLVAVLAFDVVAFAVAGLMGNRHHGVRQVIGDIAWYCLLVGVIVLVGLAVAVLVVGARGRRSTASGP